MALNINEATNSLADFVGKLYAFATTGGAGNPAWNGDRDPGANPGEFAISKAANQTNTNGIQVAMGWDTGSPNNLGIYQYNHASGAGNYNASRAGPWDQDGDSGNGFAGTTDANLNDERFAVITNTPVQYWAFAGNSPYTYLHVVCQINSNSYVHFGWGELIKFNDWEGGEYCYGHRMQGSFNNAQAIQPGSTMLLDGVAQDGGFPNPTNDMELYMATIRCENLPQQVGGGNGMWAVVGGNQSDLGLDRQSNDGVSSDTARALFVGGYRGNEIARSFGSTFPDPTKGFVPGYPIMCWYWNRSPSTIYGPMGVQPDVWGINIRQFAPGDTITIGSDDYMIFPSYSDRGDTTNSSLHQGIMYKINP